MALLDIKIYGESVLRKKSEPIPTVTPELAALAQDMLETMYDAQGVGLAAHGGQHQTWQQERGDGVPPGQHARPDHHHCRD